MKRVGSFRLRGLLHLLHLLQRMVARMRIEEVQSPDNGLSVGLPSGVAKTPARESWPPSLWQAYRDAEQQLLHVPTEDALHGFRQTVQKMLRYALRSHHPTTEGFLSNAGGFRRLVRVQAIEESLKAITPEHLDKLNGIRLLAHLDLIRGMLVDIFC